MFGMARPRLISQTVLVVSCLVIGGAVGELITSMIDDRAAAPGAQVNSMVIAQPAEPEDAIPGLVSALEDHSVVAIGESHNISEAGEFYNSLVASDRFARVADTVVVEFGNTRYQKVIDDYVSGKSVSRRLLTRVWRDTTQIGAWDAPMYEAFFRAVRSANANRPVAMRLRVLLGDPPIDWSTITSREDWEALARGRERFMARLIREKVIDKDQSALVIAGLAHVTRRGGGVTDRLEDNTGQDVYVVAVVSSTGAGNGALSSGTRLRSSIWPERGSAGSRRPTRKREIDLMPFSISAPREAFIYPSPRRAFIETIHTGRLCDTGWPSHTGSSARTRCLAPTAHRSTPRRSSTPAISTRSEPLRTACERRGSSPSRTPK
jgi:uncharacterized iron-regulated protein